MDCDVAIVGSGILGTAVAWLAAESGCSVVALRLHDRVIPRADTLRNQGWLQSGIVYKASDFVSENEYRLVALRTFHAGRAMLRELGLPLSRERGCLRVTHEQCGKIEHKARLLRLLPEDFRRLEDVEAQDFLGDFYETGSVYFLIPDCPFDEAQVVDTFRQRAVQAGARLLELDEPASLDRTFEGTIKVSTAEHSIAGSVVLIAAGAGSLPILEKLGNPPFAQLRQTPLLVKSGLDGLVMPPILVDFARGFSAVRHNGNEGSSNAVVGTRVYREPVPFACPEQRKIPVDDIARFGDCLHPLLKPWVDKARFTAGMELIPTQHPPSHLEDWLIDFGGVVFASPGRATLAYLAAARTTELLLHKLQNKSGRKSPVPATLRQWEDPIWMHFSDFYSFNDIGA